MMKREQGFTLSELLFAICVMIPVLFGIISVTYYTLRAGETSRKVMTALQDAHTVIEQIRRESDQSLNQVVATFPNGLAVSGFNTLTNEQIVVSYADPNADPLAVTVTVNWTDQGRAMTRVLSTQVTNR